MYRLDEFTFDKKSEYENALKDKKIIEDLKKGLDINKASDVDLLYRKLRNVNFLSPYGKKFDDFVFELKHSGKNADIYDGGDIKRSAVAKTEKNAGKAANKDLTGDIDLQVLSLIRKNNIKRRILIAALVVISFCSIGYFVMYYCKASHVEKIAQDLNNLKESNASSAVSDVKTQTRRNYDEEVVIPPILDEYKALYNKNKSFVGWLKIPDTPIDYPVTQSEDNEYYLKHNFDLKEDANGCLFLDKDCDIVLGNTNMIIYGHHMKSGKMFGSLVKYASEEYYAEHDTISFDTLYEKGTYKIMYVFRSHVFNADEIAFKYYQFIDCNSENEFNSAMDEMERLSLYDTGVHAHYNDKLLTLSTCDYQEKNGRFVVVAKKID